MYGVLFRWTKYRRDTFGGNMSRSGHDRMSVNGLSIAVHHPIADPHRGKNLARSDLHSVHKVAEYKEAPSHWPKAGADEGSFFFGVSPDREYWFNFRDLNMHKHYVAVVVSVQRVNAVSGRTVNDVVLEQYVNNCPKHDVPFLADRLCEKCGYKWPAQNYVTNAAGMESEMKFWIDGWRSQEGEIRQFVFTDVHAGLGVAQQLIGEERSVAIGFAIYLSKEPKPVTSHSEILRGPVSFFAAPMNTKLFSARHDGIKGSGTFQVPDYETLGVSSQVLEDHFSFDSNTRSVSGVSEGERKLGASDEAKVMSKIGTPTRQEVSHGRAVDQQVYPDPNDLEFWQDKPAAVIMLTPALQEWVNTATRNGPTVDLTKNGLGFLDGVKGVG